MLRDGQNEGVSCRKTEPGTATLKGSSILARGEERSDATLGLPMFSLFHPTGVVQKPPPHVPAAHVLHHPCR